MISTILRYTFSFLALILVQVMILNNFQILGLATAYLYIYFIITLPANTKRSLVYTLGFIMGLLVDIFCNTPGMHTLAVLFTAALRQPVLVLYFNREELESSIPNARYLGMWRFIRYAVTLVIIHHVFLFLIEAFALFNPIMMLEKIGACTLFTTLLIFVVENIKTSRQ
ncbi:rod shape-determining protein MreD [Parabacteroides sp. FAFU027]|uniref:rod shape-determining protein MreD n=1 Tax=Parabacteroides sp. FAFU027 TaxID=2922715 RepID=UPI001FAF0082|nr:rod shape-determining protein MreD [Parabacteroides sp. FAFU027]